MYGDSFKTEPSLFAPDDFVAGVCTCGYRVEARGSDTVLRSIGFIDRVWCVECPQCKSRTPKAGGRAVMVSRVKGKVLDFQI